MNVKYERENSEHQTPLGSAAFLGDLGKVNELLNHSAPLISTECTVLSSQPEVGWGNYGDPYPPCRNTPFYWAIKGGHSNVIRVLLDAHRQQSLSISDFCLETAVIESTIEVIDMLIDEGNVSTDTLFSKAFFRNRPDIMQSLVNKKADYRLTDSQGNTLLHLVNKSRSKYSKYPLESVRYLASLLSTEQEPKNIIGSTPLHSAILLGITDDVMQELFKIPLFRSTIFNRNEAGETMLHLSCKHHLTLTNIIISVCSEEELSSVKDEIIIILEQRKRRLKASIEHDIQSGFWDGIGFGEDDRKINEIDKIMVRLSGSAPCSNQSALCVESQSHSSGVAFFSVKPKNARLETIPIGPEDANYASFKR
jgi:ankyrin repeat protein